MIAGELVSCQSACRTYGSGPGAVVAVHDADCTVAAGDRVAVMGPSGSGKSTLLHLMAGLDAPSRGRVTWPGLGPREALRPGRVGMVFQGPSLLPPLDALENVALPLLLGGEREAKASELAAEAMDRLGIMELASKLPDELSGGQAQRVAVARVLAGRPRLILADEPTGQLDYENALRVVGALVAAADASGAALVVSTHDARVADRFPQRWLMRDGRLTIAPRS